MNQNDYTFQKRIAELAERAYSQSRYVFTDFLNPSERSLFYEMEKEISYVPYRIFGGMEEAERCMICFGSPEMCGYEAEFPIVCVKMEPLIQKFADRLSHRDFLGALMNLGITREKLGDIIVKDNAGFLFCLETVSDYIIQNIDFVKHTHVRCRICRDELELPKPVLCEKQLIVSSNRADAVVAKLYNISREQSLSLFRDKKVFINGRQLEHNSQSLKNRDVISVRGYGKFIFQGESGITQKKRLYVTVSVYI